MVSSCLGAYHLISLQLQGFSVRICCLLRTLTHGDGHLDIAIHAFDPDVLGCPDADAATRTEILPCAGGFRRWRCDCSAVSTGAGDLEAGELVAVDQNVGQAVFQNKVQQRVSRGGM